MSGPFDLTPLEIAGGLPLGFDESAPPLPELPADVTPLAAFEDAIRRALERPPCLVSFSGGRDSSAILAVACRLARSEGHEPPVAVTLRFGNSPGAGELDWQERVAGHVGIEEWLRLEIGDEIDYVGTVAQRLLVRHGLAYPAARVLFWLQLEPARGGSLLTGHGGDIVVGGWLPPHATEVRAGRARLTPADAAAVAYVLAPRPLKRAVMSRRLTRPAWLSEAGHREFQAARAGEFARRPARWDRFLAWEVRRRHSRALEWAVDVLAEDVGALVAHPFHDRRFVAALARAGGRRGFGNRTSVMRTLFSDDLPDDVLARPTKANFALTYFRGPTRRFARRWDGVGFDPELVDAEQLRATWLSQIVDARSALALQAAWLDSHARGLEEQVADVVEPAQIARTADQPSG